MDAASEPPWMGSSGAAQAVSGMAAGDTGPKLPYTAIFI
jgi:hypothetical protein